MLPVNDRREGAHSEYVPSVKRTVPRNIHLARVKCGEFFARMCIFYYIFEVVFLNIFEYPIFEVVSGAYTIRELNAPLSFSEMELLAESFQRGLYIPRGIFSSGTRHSS